MSRIPNCGLRAGLLLAVALLAAACSRQVPTAAPPPTPQVGVVTVEPRQVAIRTTWPGRTAATLVAEVRPQVTGIVQSRGFTEGAEVKAGALLYQLDPATYKAAYDSAMAVVARAEAGLQTAKLRVDRNKELLAINFVSQQAFDDADAAMRQAQADLAAAQAAAESARINLAYTKITAPISGRIGASTVTAGALVTANQPAPLATIQQLDPIYVDLTQSSNDLLRMRRALASGALKAAGNSTRVGLQLEDGTRFPQDGSLQFSDVSVDPGTGAVTLRALFPNPQLLLLPGMYVRAVIEEGVRDGAIVVPQQAVTRDNRGDAIALVVGADGKVESRKLAVARALGNEWLIDSGLAAGDRVIVEGSQRVRPGSAVQVVERSIGAAPAASPAQPPPAGKAAASKS